MPITRAMERVEISQWAHEPVGPRDEEVSADRLESVESQSREVPFEHTGTWHRRQAVPALVDRDERAARDES